MNHKRSVFLALPFLAAGIFWWSPSRSGSAEPRTIAAKAPPIFPPSVAALPAPVTGSGNFTRGQMIEGGQRERGALLGLFHLLAKNSPAEAARVAEEEGADFQTLATIASEWARIDPESAALWALARSNPAVRARMIGTLTASWAQVAPLAAAEFVADLPPSKDKEEAATSVGGSWGQLDPLAAVAWALSLDSADARAKALGQAAYWWARESPEEVGRWLALLPSGAERGAVESVYVGVLAESQPANAFVRASLLEDEHVRQWRLDGIARYWLALSGDAALPAVRDSTVLEKNVKAAILADYAAGRLLSDDYR